MDKLVFTYEGGLPLKLDDFLWQNGQLDASNKGFYEALQAILDRYGTDFIVSGCDYSGAPNITAGWIMLAGELIKVDAHAGTDVYFSKSTTFDARGSKAFKDASVNNTYEVNRAILDAASGSLNITTALRLNDKQILDLKTSTQQFAAANIPNLDAAKIASGVLAVARIPNLDAAKITSGVLAVARIPNLDAAKITSGIFASARIPQAATAVLGGSELATQNEVNAGTDASRIVTSATMNGKYALDTRRGVIQLATQAEVDAGTDTLNAVTSATLKGVLTAAIIMSPTLTTPWAYSAVGTHSIRVIVRNVVHISMTVFKGITGSANTTIMVLASAFRPTVKRYIRAQSRINAETNSTPQTISIDTDGTMAIAGISTTNSHDIYMEGTYYLDS